jgi:hypothetical protein
MFRSILPPESIGVLLGLFACFRGGKIRSGIPGLFLRRPKRFRLQKKLKGAVWENCGAECTIADGQRQLIRARFALTSVDHPFTRRLSAGRAIPMAKRFALWDNFRQG